MWALSLSLRPADEMIFHLFTSNGKKTGRIDMLLGSNKLVKALADLYEIANKHNLTESERRFYMKNYFTNPDLFIINIRNLKRKLQ